MDDGLMGGRLTGSRLVDSFRTLGLCPDSELSTIFDAVVRYINEGADVRADGVVDPELDCDALSMAIAFEARPVTPGEPSEVYERVDCCLPENTDAPSCKIGCGDGHVVGLERCDPGIPAGDPGACPQDCPYIDP